MSIVNYNGSLVQQALSDELVKDCLELIEYHDISTFTHSLNVGYYAELICKELNLSKKYSLEIVKGALLHDIGKLSIPITILCKEGLLTPDEYNIIKTHVNRDYVKENPLFSKIINDIIYMHHERIDGLGYPLGLSGESLPTHARIAMVADSFSAMTEHRSYGRDYSSEGAIAELRRSGTFDDSCVDALEEAILYHCTHFDSKIFVSEALAAGL